MEINVSTLEMVGKIAGFVFVLGGIWRDVRATQRDVKKLKDSFATDRAILIQLVSHHNQNHDADIRVPQTNGSEV